ncbi:MAG: site-specific integrase, partial [Acidimicrobiia bacterium]
MDTLPIETLLDSFELHLRAKNRSPKTIHSYRLAVDQLLEYLESEGRPTEADEIAKSDIQAFLAHFLATRASATARQRYASLKQFFKWAAIEGEIPADPMAAIEAPRVIEKPVPVFTVDQLRVLIKSCQSASFEGRRDEAIVRLFADTGVRLGEMAGLSVGDVDLQLGVIVV